MLALLPVLLCAVAYVYQQGMVHLEDRPRTFSTSLGWAAETLTTTGYGHDAQWSHPFMQGFVIFVQFLGVFAVFLVFPVFLIPFFEERFEGRLPSRLPRLKDHVVIYRWGPAVTRIIDELDHRKIGVVIFEEDSQIARRLHDRGRHVLMCKVQDEDPDLTVLQRARGLVVNGTDHENAVFVMSARQHGFEGTVVALAESPARRAALQKAGADAVFTPNHVLAAAIADKAITKIGPRIAGAMLLSDKVECSEVRVDDKSSLAGKTLAGAGVGTRTGATIIGFWRDGELHEAEAETPLEVGIILVAVGSTDSVRKLEELATPVPRSGPFILCGFGNTGHKVHQFLTDMGEQVIVIDASEQQGVDHVGDALDPELLEKVGVRDAQAVILTLGNDAETVFASAVIRDLAPHCVILASALRTNNIGRMRRAGTDYAFAVGQVAGKLIAFQLLGEQSLALEPKIKIVKHGAGLLAGRQLLGARVREATGCSIVAVERDGEVFVRFDEGFTIEAGDAIFVSGTQSALEHYGELYEAG